MFGANFCKTPNRSVRFFAHNDIEGESAELIEVS